ncbi:MAG: DUF5696 domain-containing protein [Bdellovibrionales bacterium]
MKRISCLLFVLVMCSAQSAHAAPAPSSFADAPCGGEVRVAPRLAVTIAENTFDITPSQALFHYQGKESSLTYAWKKPDSISDGLGRLSLSGKKGEAIPVSLEWKWGAFKERLVPVKSMWMHKGSCAVLSLDYTLHDTPLNLQIFAWMQGKSLIVDLHATEPLLAALDVGDWGGLATRKIQVPYNPFEVSYFSRQDLFASGYYDWTFSHASGQDKRKALYDPLTSGQRNKLNERFIITVSEHINETFPRAPNEPSPYRNVVAGRPVLDVWTRPFNVFADQLKMLASYGLRNGIVLIHVWQNKGFDIGLPVHAPASDRLGGDKGLKDVLAVGKAMGHEMVLHQNFMMVHDDSPLFHESFLSKSSTGERIKAFTNDAGVWAYSVRPDALIKNALMQAPEIHKRYRTTASFIDVIPSRLPWVDVDMNAETDGAGKYTTYNEARIELLTYLRNTHKGPVFGEGGWGHFFWSGSADGVTGQTYWTNKGAGPILPLIVDFNLREIHPLQVNHGMGYFERWGLKREDVFNPLLTDAYRMQEIVFGHAPFLSTKAWSVPAYALTEFELIGPVAQRTNLAEVKSILYDVDGKWVGLDEASRVGNWTRVQIIYNNGVKIVGNSAKAPFSYDALVLPQYGWMAEGKDLRAYTAIRDGLIVDYAETRNSLFANARDPADYPKDKLDLISSNILFTAPMRVNQSSRVVDFGTIKTNGTVALHREENGIWVLRPLNRERDFEVAINNKHIPMPDVVHEESLAGPKISPIQDGAFWRLPLRGATAYYW